MAKYSIIDDRGQLIREIPGVLALVALSSVATTSGSNILTVASTAALYPGMAISAPNVPRGAFIHAVKSATELELWASAFNASTGVWTTSAANAQATATASGGTAHAHGANLVPVAEWYAEGCWRNTFRTTDRVVATSGAGGLYTGPGVATIPDYTITSAGTSSWALYPDADTYTVVSDEFKPTPVKRHEGVPRGVWILVSTGGFRTSQPALKGHSCGYAGPDD